MIIRNNYKKMDRLLTKYTTELIMKVGADANTIEWDVNIENDTIYGYKFYIPETNESYVYALDVKTFNLITRVFWGNCFNDDYIC